jgi:hypothetical protein
MDIALDEVIYFDAITSHPSTGAATDADSTPSFEVFEESTDTAIVSGNLTKRTSKTGNYRGTATLSAANGFEVGKWYSIIASATVNSVAGKGVIRNFRVVPAEAQAGYPKVDAQYVEGAAPDDATTVAGAVLDEALSGHTTAGTLGKAVADVETDVDTLLTRITSTLFSGITSLAQWLGLIAGKQTGNSTARTELRATGAGSGTFDETTDSQEATRDATLNANVKQINDTTLTGDGDTTPWGPA